MEGLLASNCPKLTKKAVHRLDYGTGQPTQHPKIQGGFRSPCSRSFSKDEPPASHLIVLPTLAAPAMLLSQGNVPSLRSQPRRSCWRAEPAGWAPQRAARPSLAAGCSMSVVASQQQGKGERRGWEDCTLLNLVLL